ncbi:MAG: ATP-grasp domain-containing protein [Bacteroidota bacterium]
MSKINIGVTGTGSLIGQAIIKSVVRSDLNSKIDFIGFDYFTNTVGSFWCKKNYLLPDILKSNVTEQEWLDVIIKTIQENEIKLLFIGVDFELPLLAKYKKVVEDATGAIVMVSSDQVISIADDKYLTYQFLKENNLYHPDSWLPNELDKIKLNYPVIVKPRKGARSVGVSKVDNEIQLNNAINSVKDAVIQECVGTEETEFTCGVIFLNNEVKKVIVLNRSLKAGNTYISHYNKEYPKIITDYLIKVASILKPFGACNFQLRLDKNGVPKIFEINSRHSGTTYIRSLFGFKEVEYIINLLLFNKEQNFDLTEGTVVRYYDEFFIPAS